MISKMIVYFAIVTLLSFCSPASSFAVVPRVSRTNDAIIIDVAGVGSAPSYQDKALFGQIVDPRFVPLPSFNPYYPAMYRQQEQTPNGFVYSYGYPTPLALEDLLPVRQTEAPTCGAGPTAMPARRELTNERIVGGTSAKKNAWPFMVALKKTGNDTLICSGSLISNRRVLLAAQCLEKMSLYELSTVTVLVGMHKTNQTDVMMTRRISKVFLHRQFNAATYANDIAIIVMDAPVVLSRSVAPVCLPAADTDIDTFNDQDAIILGWGGETEDEDGLVTPFNNLQQAKVSIQSNTDCKSVGDLSRFVSDSTICVTSTADDKFTCTPDDIGGPVVILTAPGTWTILGINSYTKDCKTPGLKTRVPAFRTWIDTYLTA